MKPTLYIETSVISYLAAKPARDLVVAAHQQITHDWWEKALPLYEAFISPIVVEEISRGDSEMVDIRTKAVDGFSVLEVVPNVVKLADAYFNKLQMPEGARADSYHLAIAAWHGVDFLATWNCAHIASGRVRKALEELNAARGIRTPVIATPEELMEE